MRHGIISLFRFLNRNNYYLHKPSFPLFFIKGGLFMKQDLQTARRNLKVLILKHANVH